MQELQSHIQEHLSALLMDPSSIVKRAVLHDISSLCIFLGRQKTNDVLLSHMITYLNDRDWLLRYAFFESIVDVAACAGGRSLEEYILPLMVQALSGAFCSALGLSNRLLIFAKRRGRVGCCQSSCGSHKSLRIGSLPEDADMGVDERNSGVPLSSKYLDTTRFVFLLCFDWVFLILTKRSNYQLLLLSSPPLRNIFLPAIFGAFCIHLCGIS
jgi:hypothetical protein